MRVSIVEPDGRLAVTAPYHPDFLAKVRMAGGTWDGDRHCVAVRCRRPRSSSIALRRDLRRRRRKRELGVSKRGERAGCDVSKQHLILLGNMGELLLHAAAAAHRASG